MSTTALPPLELPAPPATGPAECDRCGARAKTRYVLLSGLDLVFCGHHSQELGGAVCARRRVLKIEFIG